MKCFDRLLALLSVSILLSSVALAQATLKFQLTDLGIVNGSDSWASAINNLGWLVGNYWVAGEQRCFLYRNGAWQDVTVGHVSPRYCDARAINDIGQIAGTYKTSWPSSPLYAFRLDPPAGFSELPPLTGTFSYGAGISPSGVVAGVMDTPSGTPHAARWDFSGSVSDLGYQCPSCQNSANAINSKEVIVGWTNTGGSFTAFSLGRRGMTLLPGLGGGFSEATAINTNGDIVGDSQTPSYYSHAVLWQGLRVIDLGLLPHTNINQSWATSVSSDTWIVGYGYGIGGGYAFLAVPGSVCGGTRNLNDLLDSSGAGWSLALATGINDHHQIVSVGVTTDGLLHAVLLTPNESPLCYPS